MASGRGMFVASHLSALAFRYSLAAGEFESHPLIIEYLPVGLRYIGDFFLTENRLTRSFKIILK